MLNSALFSSATDVWATPQELFDRLDAIYHFNVDVCALPENAKCERFFSPAEDGLKQDWRGVCWMNPPYGREISKAEISNNAKKNTALGICLLGGVRVKSFGTVITTLVYLAAIIVSGLMFGMKAVVLLVIACCCTAIGVGLIDDADYDFPKPKHSSCVGCKNYLGGGHCKINVEGECREGGGFELWEDWNGNT